MKMTGWFLLFMCNGGQFLLEEKRFNFFGNFASCIVTRPI